MAAAVAHVPTHLHPVALRTTTSAANTSVAANCLLASQAIRLTGEPSSDNHNSDDESSSDGSSSSLSSADSSQHHHHRDTSDSTLDDADDAESTNSHATSTTSTSSFACTSNPFDVDQALTASPTSWNLPLTPFSSAPSSPVVAHDYLGLRVDASAYPIHPSTVDTATPVRVLSAKQYAELAARARAIDLAEGTERALFPYLHGADVQGSNQAVYFGYGGRNKCPTPNFRGLITVSADPERKCPIHRNASGSGSCDSFTSHDSSSSPNLSPSTSSTSIFTDFSSGSMSSSISSVCSCPGTTKSFELDAAYSATPPSQRRGRGPESRTHLLVSSLLPEDVLSQTSLLPSSPRGTPRGTARFLEPVLPPQVNLRNFRIQPAKYATISDIVVYSSGGATPAAVELARRCKEAQQAVAARRRACRGSREAAIEYNVYIVEEEFAVFEREYPELVSVDGEGWRHHRTDFFEREREEMRILTEASKIGNNIWLGNSQDVPTPARNRSGSTDSSISSNGCSDSSSDSHSLDDDIEANPMSFSMSIEAHDQARMPNRCALDNHTKFLDEVESECRSWCAQADNLLQTTGADPVRLTKTAYTACSRLADGVLHPHVNDVVHVECLSTAQACEGGVNSKSAAAFLENLVALVQFIHEQANPPVGSGRLARRVLIQCQDGYTESSVLALAYVMNERECSLPEAYVWLQDGCAAIDDKGRGRSFFVYADDVQFLMKVDERLKGIREAKRKIEKKASGKNPGLAALTPPLKCGPASGLGLSLLRRSTSQSSGNGSSAATPTPGTPLASPPLGAAPTSPPPSPLPPLPKSSPPPSASASSSSTSNSSWFHDKHFDGHFPSRILPFLYLGNLNHAMNADMLAVLGITHVISVGETAIVQPRPAIMGRCAQVLGRGRSGTSSTVGASGTPVNGATEVKDMREGNALFRAVRDGKVQVLNLKGVLDDGIDPIRPFLEEAIEFVDDARVKGGKCLVHCRVGVSRSATMVIGYLMKRCGWSLEKAYLVTRSRRLNILIQPNLRLFYELHLFELDLFAQRLRARHSLSLPTASSSQARPGFSRAASIAPSEMSVDDDATAIISPATSPTATVSASASTDDMVVDAIESLSLPSTANGTSNGQEEKTPQQTSLLDLVDTSPASMPRVGAEQAEGAIVPIEQQILSVPLDWSYLAREIAQLNQRYLC